MPKSFILDTNVFYDIAAGNLRLDSIRTAGAAIFYSPITALELVGKVDLRSFEQRRGAAQAIITSGAMEMANTDDYLTDLFGYPLASPSSSFHDIIIALANAADINELSAGVPDLTQRVTRAVKVPEAFNWRTHWETRWVADILAILANISSRWKKWMANQSKTTPAAMKNEAQAFRTFISSESIFTEGILGCQTRAMLGVSKEVLQNSVDNPTSEQLDHFANAIEALTFYVEMYRGYISRSILQGRKPRPNDFEDMELLLFCADDDTVLATSEQLWVELAVEIGYAQRVLNCQPLKGRTVV